MNNLGDALIQSLKARPAELVLEDDTDVLTGADLVGRAEAVARSLEAVRARRDEPVLIACSNRAADVAGFLGVWMAGAVAVPIHRQAMPATLDRVLALSGAHFI